MHIDIVGGGSIGLLYGARLAEAGASVMIWTRREEQAAELEREGIILQKLDGSRAVIHVHSKSMQHAAVNTQNGSQNKQAELERWILLTVKQTDINDQLLNQLAVLAEGEAGVAVPIVCLQNGIGHMDRIRSRLSHTGLYAAVTTEGSKRINGYTVQHTGDGQMWLGEWHGNKHKLDHNCENKLNMFIFFMQMAGINVYLSNELENRIFNKLLINAVINPLTAIFDVQNGELPHHISRSIIMRQLFMETEAVLLKAGMEPMNNSWDNIVEVCNKTSSNISSMLSDVRAGKITEIDAINGGIIQLAEQLELPVPLNKAVTAMIHALHPKPIVEE